MKRRILQRVAVCLAVLSTLLPSAGCDLTRIDCDAADASCNGAVGALLLASFFPTSTTSTPTLSVTSGLILWLKADALTNLNDTDPVTTWSDSSGQGNNAGAVTAPTYRTNVINGLPVVRFVNTSSTSMTVPNFTRGAMTFLGVAMGTSSGGVGLVLVEQSVDANSNSGFYLTNSDACAFFVRNAAISSRNMLNTSWLNDDTFKTFGFSFAGTHATHMGFVNGQDNLGTLCGASGDPGIGLVTDTLFIGARNSTNFNFDGDVAELLIYDRALSAAEISSAECYLSTRYGISTLRTCS